MSNRPAGEPPTDDEVTSYDLARLRRWEDSGGIWRVVAAASPGVTIALCRCDGGEEQDRFRTVDPAVLRYLDGRTGNDPG